MAVIKLLWCLLPQTETPSKQPYAAWLCRLSSIFWGSDVSINTQLEMIRSNFEKFAETGIGSSAFAHWIANLFFFIHYSSVSLESYNDRLDFRLVWVSSIIFGDRSVAR